MKIKWLGHASFFITAADGTRIITDPFGDYPGLKYKPINETADIMVISHSHGDHVGGNVSGNPKTISEKGENKAGAIAFKGVETFHDTSKGKERGGNIIFCFGVDGITICHLGDLGHDLTDSEISAIRPVDVLMVPVGGFFTIDAETANKVCERIKPKIILPMHYKNEKCDFPISKVDEFLKNKKNVQRENSSEIELNKANLPAETTIIVLKPAL